MMSKVKSNCNTFFLFILFFVCVHPMNTIYSQEKSIHERFSFSLEVGNWQPHSLNDDPRFTTFGSAGATPFYGMSFLAPLGGGIGVRISVGYWSLSDIEEVEHVHSLILHPITVDIKYWLVPNYRLSAYVLYGGGVYWGVENETSPFETKIRLARAGWGANLGAGFDLAITRKFGIGMAFQYHYVRFKEPLGGVDDFSGPRISGMIFLFL